MPTLEYTEPMETFIRRARTATDKEVDDISSLVRQIGAMCAGDKVRRLPHPYDALSEIPSEDADGWATFENIYTLKACRELAGECHIEYRRSIRKLRSATDKRLVVDMVVAAATANIKASAIRQIHQTAIAAFGRIPEVTEAS